MEPYLMVRRMQETDRNYSVNLCCLWQRVVLLIIVVTTKRKEAVPNA